MVSSSFELIDIKRFAPAELDELIEECIKFNDIISLNQKIESKINLLPVIKDLGIAKLFFSKSKNMLSGMFKSEGNAYIEKAEKQHNFMVNDLGRVEKALEEKLNKLVVIERDISLGTGISFIEIIEYYNFLMESMESLVIKPILVTFRRFKKLRSKILADTTNNYDLKETREKLFIYWLFLEVYHASMYVGGITRDTTPKNVGKGIQPIQTTYPSGIPSDSLGITERDLNSRSNEMEGLFNNPFEEAEDV